jgi:hypothetical protein
MVSHADCCDLPESSAVTFEATACSSQSSYSNNNVGHNHIHFSGPGTILSHQNFLDAEDTFL